MDWCAPPSGASVRPEGVLTSMIRDHFARVADTDWTGISALHASEPVIYGRFGYGSAATFLDVEVPSGQRLRRQQRRRNRLQRRQSAGDSMARQDIALIESILPSIASPAIRLDAMGCFILGGALTSSAHG